MPSNRHSTQNFGSRRTMLRTGAAITLTALGGGAAALLSGSDRFGLGGTAQGSASIELWHGQDRESLGQIAMTKLIKEFHKTHPDIRVREGAAEVVADNMLHKVGTGLERGVYPDIAYVYGSDLASLADSPKRVDLTSTVEQGSNPWRDYWFPAREAVTVNAQALAAPALIDSLCVVYNKKLFNEAKVPFPKESWTWDDFVDRARRLTDPQKGIHGTGWPGTGDEDTVWRLWPMVWDNGGDIIDVNGKEIAFVTPGELALETIARLAKDESVYIDATTGAERMYARFTEGKIAMLAGGPWLLIDALSMGVDCGVALLPSYSGVPVTISGPDVWIVLDNGDARREAATEFIKWLLEPAHEIKWTIGMGGLPLSDAASRLPTWRTYARKTPDLDVFVASLGHARTRPTHKSYPEVSKITGETIVSVLQGKQEPARAMEICTRRANAALAAAQT